jgi:hypothetical protein
MEAHSIHHYGNNFGHEWYFSRKKRGKMVKPRASFAEICMQIPTWFSIEAQYYPLKDHENDFVKSYALYPEGRQCVKGKRTEILQPG